jgi:hypothetical protein
MTPSKVMNDRTIIFLIVVYPLCFGETISSLYRLLEKPEIDTVHCFRSKLLPNGFHCFCSLFRLLVEHPYSLIAHSN